VREIETAPLHAVLARFGDQGLREIARRHCPRAFPDEAAP
jgi:hypothetical protein